MFFKTKQKATYNSMAVHQVYHSIVEQSRTPIFYSNWEVDDTIEGRFEILVLHMFLILQRLHNDDKKKTKDFAQDLFDTMFKDMDRSLREQGIGDMGVPKHIKRMTKAFYGRIFAYKETIENQTLPTALKKNIYNGININKNNLNAVTNYTETQYKAINKQSIDDLLIGAVFWAEF